MLKVYLGAPCMIIHFIFIVFHCCFFVVVRLLGFNNLFFFMYFSKTASILGQFLSSEWFSGNLLIRLYLLCVTQLMHLNSLDDALHSLILWFPVHKGHVSSPLQSRKRWLNRLHLKQRVVSTESYALQISQPILSYFLKELSLL